MFQYSQPPSLFQQPPGVGSVSSGSSLKSQDVVLLLRQQPKEALVTTEGKEKARKPVDPPPIIQLNVKPGVDPAQHYLQSPYLFMCTSLYKIDKNEAWDGNANKSLAGSLVSSLHRLKDVDNKDGGFFVFGDISVKVQGTFRLHFSLFDLRKDTAEVLYLGSITSEPFRVLLPKDFKGMDESTYLSRAFSDQGVRLRLRKEPRAMMNKRPYPFASENLSPIRPEYSSNKRFRSDEDIRRETYSNISTTTSPATLNSYTPAPSTSYTSTTYAPSTSYTSTSSYLSSPYSMGYGGFTTGPYSSSHFRAPAISDFSLRGWPMPELHDDSVI